MNLPTIKASIVGCGNMGQAFLSALLSKKIYEPQQILCSCRREEHCQSLGREYGVEAFSDNGQLLAKLNASSASADQGSILLLAVGPRSFPQVASELKGKLSSNCLVVSFLAGISLATLSDSLQHQHIVRAMPNIAAKVGHSMTVWTSLTDLEPQLKERLVAFLSAAGEQLQLANENMLNVATALSGSGPAYVFLFLESLIDSGVRLGLSRSEADFLSRHLLSGSALMAQESLLHPAVLKNSVTTPGGTTAEGLQALEKCAFRASISEAVSQAYRRSQELSGQ